MSDEKSRKLAATVHLDGEVYEAGTKVPADIAKRIDNPKAWGETPAPSGGAAKSKGGKATKETKATEEPAGDSDQLKPPSKVSGSAVKWRDYALAAVAAAGANIDIPEGSKRGDIIEALDGAGIRTE